MVHSVTHMEALLVVAPVSYITLKQRAEEWNMMPDSHQFPAINITNYWSGSVWLLYHSQHSCPITKHTH